MAFFDQKTGYGFYGFYGVAVIAIALGIFIRFINIEGKVYWHDETYTALFSTGHSRNEAIDLIFSNELLSAADLQTLQQVDPERGVPELLQRLVEEDPQHPPLYYLVARWLMGVWDNAVLGSRLAAILFGVLLIPATYWFGLELSGTHLLGLMGAAIIATSPFHYLYAQEAREYSLWALTTVLSSAALLRSLRRPTLQSWLMYGLTLVASLYGCLLSILVIGSHCVYGVLQMRRYGWPIIRNVLSTVAISVILFLPWLRVINDVNAASWTSNPLPLSALAKTWIGHVTRLFFDINFDASTPLWAVLPVAVLALGLMGVSLGWALTHGRNSSMFLLFLLGGVTLCAFLLPDLLIGGRRSSVSRYLIPTYLSLQLIVAWFLASRLSCQPRARRRVWTAVIAIVLTAGLTSCYVSSFADTWWHKKNSHHNPAVARIINAEPGALLISSNNNVNLGELMSLSHRFNPEQKILAFNDKQGQLPQVPEGFDTVFIFNISKRAKKAFREDKRYTIEKVYAQGRLDRLLRNVD